MEVQLHANSIQTEKSSMKINPKYIEEMDLTLSSENSAEWKRRVICSNYDKFQDSDGGRLTQEQTF